MAKHKGGAGRNKEFCKRYQMAGQREKNKVAKNVRTLKAQPTNKQAIQALRRLGAEKEATKFEDARAEILKERAANERVAESG